MDTTRMSELFSIMDNAALILRRQEKISYLEALCKTGQQISSGEIGEESLKKRLEPLYDGFFKKGTTTEDVRRAFQLAVLKGVRQGEMGFYELTPDTLVILIGHMLSLLLPSGPVSLLDPAAGIANLLTGVLNQLGDRDVSAFGADIDQLLIRLAYTNANLQQTEISFIHQDGLKPLLIDSADAVISDPPVGYYTDDKTAQSYKTGRAAGKSLSHFLFIEQGLNYLKEAGYLIYLIPNDLFANDSDKSLYHFLGENALILGLIQLPLSLFRRPEAGKSLLLLRKKGNGVQMPKQALLAALPDFSDALAMHRAMRGLDQWLTDYREMGD